MRRHSLLKAGVTAASLPLGHPFVTSAQPLILEEPSQWLAPLILSEGFGVAEGISVLVLEQNARMSREIADNALCSTAEGAAPRNCAPVKRSSSNAPAPAP